MATKEADPDIEGEGILTDEDLQDLHEDILDRSERGVRNILRDFLEQDLPIKRLCCTEVELEPASNDHVLNKLPLTATHRAALIDSHAILDAILTSCPAIDINAGLSKSGYTALHVAASAGVLASVNYLTTMRACVEARDHDGSTPIHAAAEKGHNDVISVLCVRGASVNAYNNSNQTPLHLAAEVGYIDTVDLLLAKGAKVNSKDSKGQTPLHVAQVKGHVNVTTKLLSRGANVNERDNGDATPLHIWVENLEAKCKGSRMPSEHCSFSILLERGIDVNAQNQDGDTVLHMATRLGSDDLVEVLLNQDLKINLKNKQGRSALFYAKTFSSCEQLLDNGAICTAPDYSGNGILHVFASSDDVTTGMMSDAIENDADANTANHQGETPLHCACAAGDIEKVKLLIDAGAWNDVIDLKGQSILHTALLNSHPELSQWLLKKNNISLTHQDKQGNTVLHLASRIGCKPVVDYLVSRKVDINKKDYFGKTPSTMAAEAGQLRTLRTLLRNGGLVEAEPGSKVLLDFVVMNDRKVVELLLQQVDCNGACDGQGRSALHLALEQSFLDMAKLLLDRKADVDGLDGQGSLPLHTACQRLPAMESILPRIISRGICTRQDVNGASALHHGICNCSPETVNLFIRNGFDVNAVNGRGQTVVHVLLEEGSTSSANPGVYNKLNAFLRSGNFDPEKVDNNGASLMHLAVNTKDPEIVRIILESKPNINITNSKQESPLHCACANGNEKVVALLLKNDADVDAQDKEGCTPLFSAVEGNCFPVMKLLLRHGADIDSQNIKGTTCLMVAMESGKSELCLDVLLDFAPNVKMRDHTDRSMVHFAAAHCKAEVVRALIEAGINVTDADHSGNTPLHHAAFNPDHSILEMCLCHGADIDAQNSEGNTALHICAKRGSYDHVDLLLGNSAEIGICNTELQTATHLAALARDTDAMQLLIANEADVDVIDNNGNTPLLLAVSQSNWENGTLLLEQDANVSAKNVDGDSVLHIALRQDKLDMKFLKLLTFKGRSLVTIRNGEGCTPADILTQRDDIDVNYFLQELNIDI